MVFCTPLIYNVEAYEISDYYGETVYIASSGNGKCWHAIRNCSNMSGTESITLRSAISRGYSACQNCSHLLFLKPISTSHTSITETQKPNVTYKYDYNFSIETVYIPEISYDTVDMENLHIFQEYEKNKTSSNIDSSTATILSILAIAVFAILIMCKKLK